jgi:Tol biopolymer transport system component
VPPLLDQVIAKALARLPADRWDSAEKFGQALMTATMDATPVAKLELATTPSLTSDVPPRRIVTKYSIVAAAAVIAGVMGIWMVRGGPSSPESEEGAVTRSATVAPIETELNLEGEFGEALDFGTGSYSISPDGTELAYCSRDEREPVHRLWLADLTRPEGVHRVLASGSYCSFVRWSPAGDRVLFYGRTAGKDQHFAVSPQGGSLQSPTACASTDSSGTSIFQDGLVRVAPDGKQVAYQHIQNTYFKVLPAGSCDFARGDSIAVDGEYVRFWLFSWSPLGDRLAFETTHASGSSTLWTIGSDGRDRHALASQQGTFDPVWWPPTGNIYYGGHAPEGRRVMRVAVNGDGSLRAGPDPVEYFDENPIDWYSLSQDGHTAIVARTTPYYRIARLVPHREFGPPSAELIPITDTIPGRGAFGLSHDGEWIAYVRTTREGSDLFKASASGGPPQRLTRSGNLIEDWPAWSPEDDMVAFTGWWRDTVQIQMVSADGRNTGRLLDVIAYVNGAQLSWEQPGLLYTRHDMRVEALDNLEVEYGHWRGDLWQPAPSGTGPTGSFVVKAQRQKLGDTLDWSASFLPVVSPADERALLVVNSVEHGVGWQLCSQGDVLESPTLMPGRGNALGWTADGRAAFWIHRGEIRLEPIEEGDAEHVLTLPEGVRFVDLMTISGNAAHCRPRRGVEQVEFVCAVDESVTRLYLVENFDPAAR